MKKILILTIAILTIAIFHSYIVYGQSCPRPDTVFIPYGFQSKDTTNISYGKNENSYFTIKIGEGPLFIYRPISDRKALKINSLADIKFMTPFDLLRAEQSILKCEITKAEEKGSVYLDTSVNTVFKNIVLVEKVEGKYYMTQVYWVNK